MIGVSNVILFQYSEKARGYRVKYVAWKQVKADDWKIIQAQKICLRKLYKTHTSMDKWILEH